MRPKLRNAFSRNRSRRRNCAETRVNCARSVEAVPHSTHTLPSLPHAASTTAPAAARVRAAWPSARAASAPPGAAYRPSHLAGFCTKTVSNTASSITPCSRSHGTTRSKTSVNDQPSMRSGLLIMTSWTSGGNQSIEAQ